MKMTKYTLIATSAFGLESVVADELRNLGYNDLTVQNGRIIFAGDNSDIAKCNLWLRCADRLLIRMAEFTAVDFEQLYQGALAVKWEDFIPENGKMHVVGKSVKSGLYSVPDCQRTVKKAVVNSMKRKYNMIEFKEDGPVYKIEISILNDTATISVDTSGAGLHKRGYRSEQGAAPLRETLAAAIIKLSKWRPDRIFADLFCGSGTIPIEAAMIARNIAPGINRSFASEKWPTIPENIWESARSEARAAENDTVPVILASDNDKKVFNKAKENAENAGVSDFIIFQKKPLLEFSSSKKYGCIVSNPPYGERIGELKDIEDLYTDMGKVLSGFETWSFFILTSHEKFQKLFGRKADKNRKLYNGKIKIYLYQYFGEFPDRKKRENVVSDH